MKIGMEKKTNKIFRLKDFTIEDIVKEHIRNLKSPVLIGEFLLNMRTGVDSSQYVESKYANIRKNETILADKFSFLIHLIISRSYHNKYGWACLNSTVLKKVLGKEYAQLIHTLSSLNLITSTQYFELGVTSYAYKISDGIEIDCASHYEAYLKQYKTKLQTALREITIQQTEKSQINLNNNKLFYRYEKSLSYLMLSYPNEAYTFIDIHPFINDTSKNYYTSVLDRLADTTDRNITSIDRNKRIYSVLTSTPRLLKPFLNISYSCDIHNSHPLLFNKILFEFYNIPLPIINSLYNLLDNNHSYFTNIPQNRIYNVGQFLCKSLNNKQIENEFFAKIPKDVWEYILLTSLGIFWDTVIPKEDNTYNALLRSDVKVLLFSEVFYSKTMNNRCKPYAKIFKKRFPNVYKVVKAQKKGLPKEKRTVLSNRMMAMESELFHEILTLLYNKRYKVLSIHDAIVVLDLETNKTCTPALVKGIIQKTYRKHGLYPDVATDMYGEDYMKRQMQDEAVLAAKAEEYKNLLTVEANNGDADAQTILNDLNDGNREICYDDDHNVIAHLVDVKNLRNFASTSSQKGSNFINNET